MSKKIPTAPNKTSGPTAAKRAAAKLTDEKADKPKLSSTARVRATLVRGMAQLRTRANRLAQWRATDADHTAILADVQKQLSAAVSNYATAISILAELPPDFSCARGAHPSSIGIGDIVIIRESKLALYDGLFEDAEPELTVTALVGARRVLCRSEDGQRWVGPIAHVKAA